MDDRVNPVSVAAVVGPAALEVRETRVRFGGLVAVDGVSLSLNQGEFVGLIGPNGAGKSSLINAISGFVRAEAGQVIVGGQDVSHCTPHARAKAGLVRTFQTSATFGRESVMTNLMAAPMGQRGEGFWKALGGGWEDDDAATWSRANALAQRFGLDRVADNRAAAVSGGQMRLLEVGRTLMLGPKVLVLDEPFAGVSPKNRSKLADLLEETMADAGITVLMVEHRLEMVERLCSRVYVMALGKIIAEGTMADLRRDKAVVSAYLGDVGRGGAQ